MSNPSIRVMEAKFAFLAAVPEGMKPRMEEFFSQIDEKVLAWPRHMQDSFWENNVDYINSVAAAVIRYNRMKPEIAGIGIGEALEKFSDSMRDVIEITEERSLAYEISRKKIICNLFHGMALHALRGEYASGIAAPMLDHFIERIKSRQDATYTIEDVVRAEIEIGPDSPAVKLLHDMNAEMSRIGKSSAALQAAISAADDYHKTTLKIGNSELPTIARRFIQYQTELGLIEAMDHLLSKSPEVKAVYCDEAVKHSLAEQIQSIPEEGTRDKVQQLLDEHYESMREWPEHRKTMHWARSFPNLSDIMEYLRYTQTISINKALTGVHSGDILEKMEEYLNSALMIGVSLSEQDGSLAADGAPRYLTPDNVVSASQLLAAISEKSKSDPGHGSSK